MVFNWCSLGFINFYCWKFRLWRFWHFSCFFNNFRSLNFWLFHLFHLIWLLSNLLFLFLGQFHRSQSLYISKLNFLTGSSIIIVESHWLKFNFVLLTSFFLSKVLLISWIDDLKEFMGFLFSNFIFTFQLCFFLGNHVCFWSSFSQKEWFTKSFNTAFGFNCHTWFKCSLGLSL